MAAVRPMHTTTVRFDADLWARLCLWCAALGLSKAELIRAAVREFIARLDLEPQLEERMGDRLADQERRLGRVEAIVARWRA